MDSFGVEHGPNIPKMQLKRISHPHLYGLFLQACFGIEKEWYSHTTRASICNDIPLAAGLVLQVFLKCYCLKFEPTYNNKLSRSEVVELHLVRGGETLYFILQLWFWKGSL